MSHPDGILIIDFGSQFTQLIARRVREQRVYCEIHPPSRDVAWIRRWKPKGVILSGGPNSVYGEGVPTAQPELLALGVPVLGLCYGMQLLAHLSGGHVVAASRKEYGRADVRVEGGKLFQGFDPGATTPVWMSHGDHVDVAPPGWRVTASSDNSPIAAIEHATLPLHAVQFHPEVAHTPRGGEILANFLFEICGCKPDWTPEHFVEMEIARIRETGGPRPARHLRSLGWRGLGGGRGAGAPRGGRPAHLHLCRSRPPPPRRAGSRSRPPSAAASASTCARSTPRTIFSPTLPESPIPRPSASGSGTASSRCSRRRRRKVGDDVGFLVQGTLYPDVIESFSPSGGPSVTIKTHHNVGGLPDRLPFKLIEPLRELFKDEVRQVGRELGLPEDMVGRHPFPGPGLAIRILGEVTVPQLDLLRAADAIYLEEIRAAGLYDQIWQAFAVLLPIRSVGVMGDFRSYDQVIGLRAVTSRDGMTADWFPFPA